MKRITRIIVSIVAATCCLLALAGCSSYPSVQEATEASAKQPTVSSPDILNDGVLTIGINSSNAPYAWAPDSDSSVLEGVDVEMALALAEQMGLTAKFVNVGTSVNGASAGDVDIVMGVSAPQITDGLNVVIGSYAETAPAVFAKDVDAEAGVTLDSVIAGPTGVQTDSASSKTLAEMAPAAQQQGFSTLNDAFDALEAGTVRYVVCDSFMGGYLAASYGDISLAGALQMPTTRGVAVAASNATLQAAVQQAMDALATNGIQGMIRTAWVGDLPTITAENQIAAATPEVTTDPVAEGTEGETAPAEGEALPEEQQAA